MGGIMRRTLVFALVALLTLFSAATVSAQNYWYDDSYSAYGGYADPYSAYDYRQYGYYDWNDCRNCVGAAYYGRAEPVILTNRGYYDGRGLDPYASRGVGQPWHRQPYGLRTYEPVLYPSSVQHGYGWYPGTGYNRYY